MPNDYEPEMTYAITKAVRESTPAFIALSGPSGSGKTRSALELATGLAGAGKILLASSEGMRALHYADLYEFDHVVWPLPYTPESCAELIGLAESKGYAVLIVDSASDEYEGEGGLQEIRDSTNDEFWARTKARHKHALINRIRRSTVHSLWCLRAEERVRISKVGPRTVVESLGWQPICEKRFLYEMQSSFRFDPDHPGCPIPIKLYDIHAQFFPPDKPITRAAGASLAAWCAGGARPPTVGERIVDPPIGVQLPARPPIDTNAPAEPAGLDYERLAWEAARIGQDALRVFWDSLTAAQKHNIGGRQLLDRLKLAAEEADAMQKEDAT